MNNKARVIWWTLFILIIAFGIFFSSTAFVKQIPKSVKGTWQTGFLKHNVLQAERQLLADEAVARNIGTALVLELAGNGGFRKGETSRCGKIQGVNAWNRNAELCLPEIEETFSASALKKLQEKIPNRKYTAVGTDAKFFYALGAKEDINSNYGEYIFNTSISADMGYSFSEYKVLFTDAFDLLAQCNEEKNLQSCLEKNRRAYWRFTDCEKEEFKIQERRVVFCVRSPSSSTVYDYQGKEIPVKYSLTLDFTPEKPFPIEELVVEKEGMELSVRFPQDPSAEGYKIYYTDWAGAPVAVQRTHNPAEVFETKTTGFVEVRLLHNPLLENCVKEKMAGEVYLCEGEIYYLIKDSQIISDETYYVGVTSIKEEKESGLTTFILAK
ncbi:hypothetical protein J4421_06260 [Candidatus Woesearchaeota archaeon]|nr:hypothetical protein [Candidatus Woesearchaeota archaeon]